MLGLTIAFGWFLVIMIGVIIWLHTKSGERWLREN